MGRRSGDIVADPTLYDSDPADLGREDADPVREDADLMSRVFMCGSGSVFQCFQP